MLTWPAWLTVRALRGWFTVYRRTWRSSVFSTVLGPLLYLGAMGFGLGSLVDRHGTAAVGGVPYLEFVAPAILAVQAMQSALTEATFPVFSAIKWDYRYIAARATPLRPADIYRGHVLFIAIRLAMNSAIFLVIAVAFGSVRSAWAVTRAARRYLDRPRVRRPGRGVGDHRPAGHGLQLRLPLRDDPADGVLRDVLPAVAAARLVAAGRLRHAPVARRGAVPRADAGDHHRGEASRSTWPTCWP